MAYKIYNTDFFKTPMGESPVISVKPEEQQTGKTPVRRAEALRISPQAEAVIANAERMMQEAGFPELAAETGKIRRNVKRDRFTIAVVGEFSRGKSTLINRLLEQEAVPVGDLPTTAVLTRIRYHEKPMLAAFDERHNKVAERELSGQAWDGLKAKNFGGDDFRGTVFAGVRSEWLNAANIELIDTPGAGDLNENRAKVVGDALLGCDGAVITVSAQAPMSLSEKLFIEERLTARKMPFLLLALTKLDTIPLHERSGIIRYVKNKLAAWKLDIPVFVPSSVELPDNEFRDIIGTDPIRREFDKWISCPERVSLTEQWMLGKTADLLNTALTTLREKQILLEENDRSKRSKMIAEKRQMIARAELCWGDLRLQMQKRCNNCYQLLVSRIDDTCDSITERLQYEAGHAPDPKRWWDEDFPYRSKLELTNMAVSVDQLISRQIQEDACWYASSIEKSFRTHILYQRQTISDKTFVEAFDMSEKLAIESLHQKRKLVRVGSAVLTIAGFMAFSAAGFAPIMATMGIGTGTALISEEFFRKQIEKQREEIKKAIAREVPVFVQGAMAESEKRLEAMYTDIIREAETSEERWKAEQEAAIRSISAPEETAKNERSTAVIHQMADLLAKINGMLCEEG